MVAFEEDFMKPSSRPPKAPSLLSDSVWHRLNKYALAASAAGVGLLCLAEPVEARVVYTPAHKWLPLNRYYYLDLNHDGIRDFELQQRSSQLSALGIFFVRSLNVGPAGSTQQPQNEIVSFVSQNFVCAAALPKGTKVGGNSQGWANRAWMFENAYLNSGTKRYFGPWIHETTSAYLGLQFTIKGQVHYGWARLGHIRHARPIGALLMGYAYETVPNKPIIAGKTKGPNVVTVQPASLGHLAAGASAIPAWRSQK